MPRRSNFFQRLVFMIEQSLADVPGTTVRESVLLKDQRTGEDREVDILIESSISGYVVRIAIECRDHRRRCDSTWIDQLIGKYQDLPVDKVIAVARRGFSASAMTKASQCGIETLSFKEASRTAWNKLVPQPEVDEEWYYREVILQYTTFRLRRPEDQEDDVLKELVADETWVINQDGDSLSLPDFTFISFRSQHVRDRINAEERKLAATMTGQSATSTIALVASVDYHLSDGRGREWPVDQAIIELQVRVAKTRTESFEYRGQGIAISSFKDSGDVMDAPTGWVSVEPNDIPKDGRVTLLHAVPVTNGKFGPMRLPLELE